MIDTKEMFYFGPWDRAGHYLVGVGGSYVRNEDRVTPWTPGQLDGGLQPHFKECERKRPGASPDRYCSCSSGKQGLALLHHKDGWTALAFWDRSVDTRGACCSVYIAKGINTFDEMVAIAKTHFKYRWDKQKFEVTEFREDM